MTNQAPGHRVVQALRVTVAASIALVVAEYAHLPHANLAVWTTHMVMSSFTHTAFQKGVERIVGRGVGILLGILIVNLVGELTPLALLLEIAAMLGFFYAHFCGRLAYTYMNAGLYLNAVVMMNTHGISAAWVNGGWMFLALVIGVSIAYIVMWATGGESNFSIDPGPGHLFPLQEAALSRSAQMVATMLGAQYLFFALDMPPISNTLGLFLLAVIPNLQSALANHRVFTGSILLATGAAVVTYLVLNRLPHFPLFLAIIALAFFFASWIGQASGPIKAMGTEFGTVYPLLVIAPYEQIQSPASTFYNIVALYVFTGVAIVMGYVWLALGLAPEPGHPSAQSPPRPAGPVRNEANFSQNSGQAAGAQDITS